MNYVARFMLLGVFTVPLVWSQSPDIILSRQLGNSKFKNANEFIETEYRRLGLQTNPATSLASAGLADTRVDADGNIVAARNGEQDDILVAVVAKASSPAAVSAMSLIVAALNSAGISTRSDLLFVELASRQGDARDAFSDFLNGSAYRERLKSCVVLDSANENTVLGRPNSIGSTIVQYGLQSISAYGMDANYEAAEGILTIPLSMNIPSIGLGVGRGEPTVKGVQVALTVILALAGLSRS